MGFGGLPRPIRGAGRTWAKDDVGGAATLSNQPTRLSGHRTLVLMPEPNSFAAIRALDGESMDTEFDGLDQERNERFKVWHTDGSARVVFVTLAPAATRADQRACIALLFSIDINRFDWRYPDEFEPEFSDAEDVRQCGEADDRTRLDGSISDGSATAGNGCRWSRGRRHRWDRQRRSAALRSDAAGWRNEIPKG